MIQPKPLRTSDLARRAGVSVNTIRQYEAFGYLPDVPRAANGYRCFDERHLQHVFLTRYAMRCTWFGGAVRRMALDTLRVAATGDYDRALERASHLKDLLLIEKQHAEAALQILETWVTQSPVESPRQRYSIGDTAKHLHVTLDELRSWERNGFVEVPRAPNGYRIYGTAEIERLLVIRALRRARYSSMSILRLLQHLDAGETDHLRDILNNPIPDETIETYPTDRWLSSLAEMLSAADAMRNLLQDLANPA